MGTASRMRFRLAGAAVAALLMVSPILSSQAFAAQGSSDIDPDAAQALLSEAQDLIEGVDPLVDDDRFVATQDAELIAGKFITGTSDTVGDFYLEFSVEAPEDVEDAPFDFGISFRYSEESDDEVVDYELIFASDDGTGDGPYWIFANSFDPELDDELNDDVFPVEAGATYDIALAVIGDEAAFSINGEPIAILDVSEISDPGRVYLGSGFDIDTTVDNRDVAFSSINLYGLDDVDSTGEATEEATEDATEETDGGETESRGEEETPTEEATEETGGDADVYASPNYDYSLDLRGGWELTDIDNNPGEGMDLDGAGIDLTNGDYVILNNGVSSISIYGGESTLTAEECVNQDVAYFTESSSRYEFFSIAKAGDDEDLAGDTGDGGYYTVIWVTDIGTEDQPNDPGKDTTIYIECRPIVDGKSIMLIEHYALDADYNDEIAAREELLSGLDMTGGLPTDDPTEEADETPTEEADETPTEEASGGDLTVTMDSVGTSDVEGEAVVSSSGTSRSTIEVVATGAPEGALVIVQEGSCDDLSGVADFDAGSIDENGESSDRIRITPDELDGNYALTIVDAETEDYAEPLACGDIG
ncbi:hypothetical protein BH09CHL1_BH09CHL1_25260 [soil metagenome]